MALHVVPMQEEVRGSVLIILFLPMHFLVSCCCPCPQATLHGSIGSQLLQSESKKIITGEAFSNGTSAFSKIYVCRYQPSHKTEF